MDIKKRVLVGGLGLALTLGCASANPLVGSVAPSPERDLFVILAGTSISLEDAIQAAEKTVSGVPIKAELENDSKPNTFRVVMADHDSRTLTYLKVDSVSGVVLDSRTYRVDAKKVRLKAKKG